MSKKYWLIPPSRRVSRNRGSWVLGVQAPTTTRFSPLSRMVSAICWAASVEHMKRPSSACSTLSRDRAQSTVSGISTTLPIFAPQWHMNTPTRGSSSVTSLSCGYTLSLASLPRLLWRSSPQRDSAPLAVTTDSGISIGPWFQGPMDIPESVVTASGAESLCGELLHKRRGKLAKDRVYPHERDVTEEEPRVGVFMCHCGANIGRVVDIPETVDYALSLDNVEHAEEGLFLCSTDAAQQIADTIRDKGLNRVVVGACTPRTHEPLFRDTLREGGINQYFFDMANIREHCSWVHSREKEKATEKAKDIVRMSVSRVCELQPLEEHDLPVNNAGLVVGGVVHR